MIEKEERVSRKDNINTMRRVEDAKRQIAGITALFISYIVVTVGTNHAQAKI